MAVGAVVTKGCEIAGKASDAISQYEQNYKTNK